MHILSSVLNQPFFSFYTFLLTLLLAVVTFEYKKRTKFFHSLNQGAQPLKGPFSFPFVGNLFLMAKLSRLDILKNYLNMYQHYSHLGVGRFWLGNRLFIVLFLPEYIEVILGDVKKVQKPEEYKIMEQSPLGKGLISQKDTNIWKFHRKIVTPTFHFNVLKTYIPIFHEETLILLKKLEENLLPLTGNQKSQHIFVPNLHPLITLTTFDMILRSAFGVRIHAQENENHSFVSAMSEATKIIQDRISMPWLLLDSLFSLLGYKSRQEEAKKICYDFTESVIRTKRSEYKRTQHHDATWRSLNDNCKKIDATYINGRKTTDNSVDENLSITNKNRSHIEFNQIGYTNNGSMSNDISVRDKMDTPTSDLTYDSVIETHKSFLELIIENEVNEEVKMSDEEIRDNVITIMFAGQDTTATTNCMTLLMLAIHPEIQNKVLEELDDVFGTPGKDDGHVPVYAELTELHTLDRVLKESCRLYPSAPVFGRQMTEDTQTGPFVLPKGSTVIFFNFGLHRDGKYHQKPKEFWPDRFLPCNARTHHPFSFIPFGAGSRNCVGQKYAMLQMKTVLSTILRKYRVSTDESIKSIADVDKLVSLDMTLSVQKCPLVLTPR